MDHYSGNVQHEKDNNGNLGRHFLLDCALVALLLCMIQFLAVALSCSCKWGQEVKVATLELPHGIHRGLSDMFLSHQREKHPLTVMCLVYRLTLLSVPM